MDLLKKQSDAILKKTPLKHFRNLYFEIPWNNRLIGIKGARGVGKTTLMLQRMALGFPDKNKALYVTLDNIWFADHSLIDLAELSLERGITHLFLDEVHKFRGWQQQIKNIYDLYQDLSIVFTGSSLLEIDNSISDLSRRLLLFNLRGLSFREYLAFEGYDFKEFSLEDILYNHTSLANKIIEEIPVLKLFHRYLVEGYYPFYKDSTRIEYLMRVGNIITTVIDNDIPAVENVEYNTLVKCKKLLAILASQSPSPLNASNLANSLDITHNQLVKILFLLDRAEILRLIYYKTEINPKSIIKPQKILFDNSSLLYALGNENLGKIRETFLASRVNTRYKIGYPKNGDLIIENRYLLEIGGKDKSYRQIADIPDSYLAVDNIEFGVGNRIPLWLFGFLY